MSRLLILIVSIFLASQSYAISLCVDASKANLRNGPGSNFKVSWTVGRYMPLLRIDSKSGWSRVKDVDGQIHWVFTRLLTQRTKCLVIKTAKANLRTGPGVKFPLAEYRAADRYETFKRIQKKGSWYNVVNDIGENVWVHESNAWTAKKRAVINF